MFLLIEFLPPMAFLENDSFVRTRKNPDSRAISAQSLVVDAAGLGASVISAPKMGPDLPDRDYGCDRFWRHQKRVFMTDGRFGPDTVLRCAMDADADGAMGPERGKRIAVLTLAATICCASTLVPARAEAPAEIRPSEPGAGTERLIETLSARLLAAHSATAVLEAWCAERGLAADPRLTAVRVPGPEKPLSADQRERLAIAADEPVRYRRVWLTCGGHVLSEADNWYVPGRLTPEMNAVLEDTQTPFGRVVHPLSPTRRNLSLTMLWTPGEAELPGPEKKLFFVEAVLSTAAGVPFCEVAETYTGAVLARGGR